MARITAAQPEDPLLLAGYSFGGDVAFATDSSLVSGDTNSLDDVYWYDGTTTRLVSRATGGTGAVGNGKSNYPSISDDGTAVAFVSSATNLGGNTPGVFVRDMKRDRTRLVSKTPSGDARVDQWPPPSVVPSSFAFDPLS